MPQYGLTIYNSYKWRHRIHLIPTLKCSCISVYKINCVIRYRCVLHTYMDWLVTHSVTYSIYVICVSELLLNVCVVLIWIYSIWIHNLHTWEYIFGCITQIWTCSYFWFHISICIWHISWLFKNVYCSIKIEKWYMALCLIYKAIMNHVIIDISI